MEEAGEHPRGGRSPQDSYSLILPPLRAKLVGFPPYKWLDLSKDARNICGLNKRATDSWPCLLCLCPFFSFFLSFFHLPVTLPIPSKATTFVASLQTGGQEPRRALGVGACDAHAAASSGDNRQDPELIYSLPWPSRNNDGRPPEPGPRCKETSVEKARHAHLIGEHRALWPGDFPVCPPKRKTQ